MKNRQELQNEHRIAQWYNTAVKAMRRQNRNTVITMTRLRELRNKENVTAPRDIFNAIANHVGQPNMFQNMDLSDAVVAERERVFDASFDSLMDNRGLYPTSMLDPDLRMNGVRYPYNTPVIYTNRQVDNHPTQARRARGKELTEPASIEYRQGFAVLDPEEQFRGWSGDGQGDDRIRGIGDVISGYLSPADIEKAQGLIDSNETFTGAQLEKTVAILRELRSSNRTFTVDENRSRDNQIELSVKAGRRNVNIRAFDINDSYIGRVYDSYYSYYFIDSTPKSVAQKAEESRIRNEEQAAIDRGEHIVRTNFGPELSVNDSLAIMRFALGDAIDSQNGKPAMFQHARNGNVQVFNISESNPNYALMVRQVNEGQRFKNATFISFEEARKFIRDGIEDAGRVYEQDFNARGLDLVVQDTLDYRRAVENGASETVLEMMNENRSTLEEYLSNDANVSEVQLNYHDAMIRIYQAVENNESLSAEELAEYGLPTGITVDNPELIKQLLISDGKKAVVGSYTNGFNPNYVAENMSPVEGHRNTRQALQAALKTAEYNLDLIKGNEFKVQAFKDNLIKYDPETATAMADVTDPRMLRALTTIQTTLAASDVQDINIAVDDQGVVHWEGQRMIGKLNRGRNSKMPEPELKTISADIGQIMLPDEDGIIRTKFASGENYGFIPGGEAYFAFDGEGSDETDYMKNFRVMNFENALDRDLKQLVRSQVLRPYMGDTKNGKDINNIPQELDASSINTLYHGGVYGERIDMDFFEKTNLSEETAKAIVKTESQRVKLDKLYAREAGTDAAIRFANEQVENDNASFDMIKVVGGKSIRELGPEKANYVDLTLTGNGPVQGLALYLTEGAVVNPDGSVTPSEGLRDKDGNLVLDKDGNPKPDKTSMMKLDYFKYSQFSATDRTQMGANQLRDALYIDEVGASALRIEGLGFEDPFLISKDFAESHKVRGAKLTQESLDVFEQTLDKLVVDPDYDYRSDLRSQNHGMMWTKDVLDNALALRNTDAEAYRALVEEEAVFRPLQPGDKLSNIGGNKGVIDFVVDRDANIEDSPFPNAVAIFNANKDLDVVFSPDSTISRMNTSVFKELQDGEVRDIVNPLSGETYKGALGRANIIVTDLTVDTKTHAYTEEDVASGKGRKASGQLAWALQSKGAETLMQEIYGHNDQAWNRYREYMIATGLDMTQSGDIQQGYTPRDITQKVDGEMVVIGKEERPVITFDEIGNYGSMTGPEVLAAADLKNNQGAFLKVPFEMTYPNGQSFAQDEEGKYLMPILPKNMRSDTELLDGSMKLNDYTQSYFKVFDAVADFNKSEMYLNEADSKDKQALSQEKMAEAVQKAQRAYNEVANDIVSDVFNGSGNGKYSYLRDNIMGKRMDNSATAVSISDPSLDIGQAGMNQDMMDALDIQDGDTILAWRDPVLRDGAVRSFTAVLKPDIHGISVNPISAKSHDMDFDGDTMGVLAFKNEAVNQEIREKFSHEANMLDYGASKDENGEYPLYFQSGMDLAAAESKYPELAEKRADAQRLANQGRNREALETLNTYAKEAFSKSTGVNYVDLTSDQTIADSYVKIVNDGAKGSPSKLKDMFDYAGFDVTDDKELFEEQVKNGSVKILGSGDSKKTIEDANELQFATGVKTDDTGKAGAYSQKLMAAMRDVDAKAALEVTYPVTQVNLQIKHDAQKAMVIDQKLNNDFRMHYAGKKIGDYKKVLKKDEWVEQGSKLLDELDVDHNRDQIERVADALADDKGNMRDARDAMMQDGALMDKVAYSGEGYDVLNEAAKNGGNILDTEATRQFAPIKMKVTYGKAEKEKAAQKVEADAVKALEKYHAKQATSQVSTQEAEMQAELDALNEMEAHSTSVSETAIDDGIDL